MGAASAAPGHWPFAGMGYRPCGHWASGTGSHPGRSGSAGPLQRIRASGQPLLLFRPGCSGASRHPPKFLRAPALPPKRLAEPGEPPALPACPPAAGWPGAPSRPQASRPGRAGYPSRPAIGRQLPPRRGPSTGLARPRSQPLHFAMADLDFLPLPSPLPTRAETAVPAAAGGRSHAGPPLWRRAGRAVRDVGQQGLIAQGGLPGDIGRVGIVVDRVPLLQGPLFDASRLTRPGTGPVRP